MIYRVEVLSLLSDKKQDCFHVKKCGNISNREWSKHLAGCWNRQAIAATE